MAIQIRRGTDAQWEAGKNNIVVGEPAVTTDTERAFIGTGSGTYVELATIGDTDVTITDIKENAFIHRTASGSIASFSDGSDMPMDSLIADINPVQNLNGYTHPWSGGGGKNKLAPWITNQTLRGVTYTVNSDGSFKTSGTASGGSSQPQSGNITLPNGTYVLSGCPSGGSGTTYFLRVLLYNSSDTLLSNVSDYGNGGTFTIDSTVSYVKVFASVNNGITAPSGTWYPMIRLSTETATYEPYSNICPISGWDSVDVNVTGINVWDEEWESGDINVNDGSKRANSSRLRTKNFIPVAPSTTYYSHNSYANAIVCFYDASKGWVSQTYHEGYESALNNTFTTPSWCYYIMFYANGTTYNNDISINYPSTDTAYYAYNGNTTTVSLGQTVYGGSLNVTTGVLTIDKFMYSFTGNETFATNSAWGDYAKLYNTGVSLQSSYTNQNQCKSSHLTVANSPGWVGLTPNNFMTAGGSYIGIGYDGTVNELKAWLTAQATANTPVQVVGLLATPTTVQLTPQQVNTLLGQNNVWADSGDVEVTYTANASLTIEELINAITSLGGNV